MGMDFLIGAFQEGGKKKKKKGALHAESSTLSVNFLFHDRQSVLLYSTYGPQP